jgi:sodium/hydrogen antiporter
VGSHSCRRFATSVAGDSCCLNAYTLTALAAGAAVLLAAWLPAYLDDRPLSLPMVLLVIGAIGFTTIPQLPDVDPRTNLTVTEHATEFAVLISLLGAGLALDRSPGWRRWATTWRLLGVAMPLTIGLLFVAGWAAGVAPATALLFGALIAPTDPVLAADVHVGEPTVDEPDEPASSRASDVATDAAAGSATRGDEDEVRFALTSEAGLNDGLAFPFVFAAIALAVHTSARRPGNGWLVGWVLDDLLLRVTIGLVVGVVAGLLLSKIVFDPPGPLTGLADTTEGFVAVGAILVTYGLTEVAHGYGFLAVFVAAVTLRQRDRDHSYHRVMHQFTGQLEQLLSVALLVLLGGALATGLLDDLSWRGIAAAFLVIFVVRPFAGWIALGRTRATSVERRAIGFFGIRGIGSIYYLAFATEAATFADSDELWSATAFTVLLSIFVHGVTATPVMRALDRRRARRLRSRTSGEMPPAGGTFPATPARVPGRP